MQRNLSIIEIKETTIRNIIAIFASFNDISPEGSGLFGLPILSISKSE